nr:hypothetical protein [Butyrivibrio sp. AD3002]
MAQVVVIKVIDFAPKAGVSYTTFRYEAVDMRIPFQGTSKCVKNQNVTRCEVLTFVDFVEHTINNTADSFEKTVKKVAVFEKVMT